jgi:acetyltransferase-like isoleucine patch superfamily enzyme
MVPLLFENNKYLNKVNVRIRGLYKKISVNIFFLFTRRRINWSSKLHIHSNGDIDLGHGATLQEHTAIEVFENGYLSVGSGTSICRGSILFVLDNAHFSIGDNSYIGEYNNIRCTSEIRIGNNVRISQLITITDGQYNINEKNRLIGEQGYEKNNVIIGDDVWVGSNSVILPGVKIGRGVVVGAGSIVTKDISDYAVVMGNPAKVIRYRI